VFTWVEQRKRFNEEFKKQAVNYLQEQTKTVEEIAKELDFPVFVEGKVWRVQEPAHSKQRTCP